MTNFISLILFLSFSLIAGCTHSLIAKECKEVKDDSKFVCKSILPWQ